jgi:hypothetical protein
MTFYNALAFTCATIHSEQESFLFHSFPDHNSTVRSYFSRLHCIMSAPVDAPIKMEYRPRFDSLPYRTIDDYDNTSEAFQSFPFLPEYRDISFEEQRLCDTTSPPSMATGKVGSLTPSALESIKAACNKNHKASKLLDIDVVECVNSSLTFGFAFTNRVPGHHSPSSRSVSLGNPMPQQFSQSTETFSNTAVPSSRPCSHQYLDLLIRRSSWERIDPQSKRRHLRSTSRDQSLHSSSTPSGFIQA